MSVGFRKRMPKIKVLKKRHKPLMTAKRFGTPQEEIVKALKKIGTKDAD